MYLLVDHKNQVCGSAVKTATGYSLELIGADKALQVQYLSMGLKALYNVVKVY